MCLKIILTMHILVFLTIGSNLWHCLSNVVGQTSMAWFRRVIVKTHFQKLYISETLFVKNANFL